MFSAKAADALLIIDLQPDFMPGGSLAVAGGDEIVAPIARLMGDAGFFMTVATQDWHPEGHVSFASYHGKPLFSSVSMYGEEQTMWPDHCVQGTPGAALHKDLPLESVDMILRKGVCQNVDSYSAFRENVGPDGLRDTTGLGAFLKARGVTRVILCGLARDFCVKWSALDAKAEGFEVVVIDDLTRSVFPDNAPAVSAELESAGITHTTLSALA